MTPVRPRFVLLSAFLALALATLSCASDKPKPASAAQQLADAERAFAKMSVDQGIPEAFVANFADDGLEFTPKPENAKALYGKRQPSPKPAKVTLDWSPEFTDVSSSGDFGYNTGPYFFAVLDPKAPKKFWGQFFSVWRKQPDGNWKVAIDFGVETPAPASEAWPKHRAADRRPYRANKVDATQERANLLQADRELSRLAAEKGVLSAYTAFIDPSLRLLRDNSFPALGKEAALKLLGAAKGAQVWTPTDGSVSRAADLGYTYGGCETSRAGKLERCYYLHVWKRDAKESWKLVADVQKTVPPGK